MPSFMIFIVLLGGCCCLFAIVGIPTLLYVVHQTKQRSAESSPKPQSPPATDHQRTVRAVGFFQEMQQGQAHHPSIHDCISRGTDSPQIVAYLKAGEMMTFVPGPVEDPVHPEKGFIASMHILTDGTWAWPESLAYFVSTYAVELPQTFLQHLEDNSYTIPEPIDLNDLEIAWDK